tara:strand:- start:107 stop:316 length:210 start_codon:yes stop_codon:yes gene_type:complete
MISTIFGMIIISMVTVSLLVALTIGNKTIKEAGVNPLSKQEKDLILKNGYKTDDLEIIELQIKNLLSNK